VSVPVGLAELRSASAGYRASPYLLTTSDDGRPHAVAVTVTWDGDELVAVAGGRTRANGAARPLVSLLWPPSEPGGYSLIVDGDAVIAPSGAEVRVRPTKAVLHRPATAPAPAEAGACGSDCVPLLES